MHSRRPNKCTNGENRPNTSRTKVACVRPSRENPVRSFLSNRCRLAASLSSSSAEDDDEADDDEADDDEADDDEADDEADDDEADDGAEALE